MIQAASFINPRKAVADPRRVEAGKVFEEEMFGFRSIFDPDEIYRRRKRIKFEGCYTRVLQDQEKLPWDIMVPSTEFSENLFRATVTGLPNNTRNRLRLYCALGMLLDFCFGIDGFFILAGNTRCPATFDLSRYGSLAKRNNLKAHGLITRDDMMNPERTGLIGEDIAKALYTAFYEPHRKITQRRLWV